MVLAPAYQLLDWCQADWEPWHVFGWAMVENFFENLLPDSREIRLRLQQRFAATNRGSEGAGGGALPQEDVCQALGLPPGLNYQCDGGPGIAVLMTLLLF